jgi:signal transduction histidine kinase
MTGRIPLRARAALFALLYFAGAWAGYGLTHEPTAGCSFWPDSGLFLAVLLLQPVRTWPIYLLAAVPANLGFELLTGRPLGLAACLTAANCAEALLGAWLIRRWRGDYFRLDAARDVWALVAGAVMLAPVVSAMCGVWATGVGSGGSWVAGGFAVWVAKALGVLVVAPLALALLGRTRAGHAQAVSQALAETVCDSTSDLIWAVDAGDHGMVTWNRAVEEYFRCHRELVVTSGMQPEELLPAGSPRIAQWHAFYQRACQQGPFALDYELTAGGQTLALNFGLLRRDGAVFGISVFGRDITEQRRMESHLRQMQKMDAIGQLAGGMAHDFNNQLGGIFCAVELMRKQLKVAALQPYVDQIWQSAERAAALTRQLLTFARKGELHMEPVDAHALLGELVAMLARTLDKRITLKQSLAAGEHHVMGDHTQLQNALLNLALNARDAMPGGGELTFSTMVAAHPDVRVHPELPTGRYLQLSVTDSGSGMSEATKQHLFEPFFTTKEVGKGTGLGLAAVHGTIKSHHGTIMVHTELGHGTTFHLFLPLIAEPRIEALCVNEVRAVPVATPVQKGGGRILVVDDEAALRQVLEMMLQNMGYEVVLCEDGAKAVNYYRTNWQAIDLVILDMVMPNGGGREIFQLLQGINPMIQVLLASGYGLDGQAQRMLDEGVAGFLQKPFKMADLSGKVATILGAVPR